MPDARLRALLLIAGFGSVLVLVDLLDTPGALAGLGAMALATLLSAPAAPSGRSEVNWWSLLAVGTGLTAIGIAIGLGLETVGGLLSAIGAGLAVVGSALGYPAAR